VTLSSKGGARLPAVLTPRTARPNIPAMMRHRYFAYSFFFASRAAGRDRSGARWV